MLGTLVWRQALPICLPLWRFPAPALALCHARACGLELDVLPQTFPEPRSLSVFVSSQKPRCPSALRKRAFSRRRSVPFRPAEAGRFAASQGEPRMQKSAGTVWPQPASWARSSAFPVDSLRTHTHFLSHPSPHPAGPMAEWSMATLCVCLPGCPGCCWEP